MKRMTTLLIGLCIAATVLPACNSVGPRALRGARINYNDAIARSWDQQLLLNLVRLKYRDTPVFLEVTSISTQYSMAYSAGISPGFGNAESVARTLTSAGAVTRNRNRSRNVSGDLNLGIDFVERPTITYAPLQGEKFVTQLLSPIPLNAISLVSQSGWSLERVTRMCVQNMGGLDNASSASGPTPSAAPNFEDFAEVARLLRQLQVASAIETIAEENRLGPALLIRFSGDAANGEDAQALKSLLGLSKDVEEIRFSVDQTTTENPRSVSLRTRSVIGVLYLLSNSVDVPPRHSERGLVTVTRNEDGSLFDWSEVTGGLMKVSWSPGRPSNASVAIPYRGVWFYIADDDLDSKATFGLLSYLFYLQAGEIQNFGPTLTLPVGQ